MVFSSEKIPASDISTLKHDNSLLLSRLYGDDFLEKRLTNSLSTTETVDANEALADELYGSTIASLLREGAYGTVLSMRDEITESTLLPIEVLDGIDMDKVGLIVVRPELYSNASVCRDLLVSAGFNIITDRDAEITFAQYLSLYPHGLAIPESHYDFPTRTLNYINRTSRLIVFSKQAGSEDNRAATTIASVDHKGTQGTFRKDTLRGHIALKSLDLYFDDHKAIDEASIALDPLAAYQKLVSGEIASNGIHNSVEKPPLFYAAQGVHVPDRDEIDRDIRVLCTLEDIEIIRKEIA